MSKQWWELDVLTGTYQNKPTIKYHDDCVIKISRFFDDYKTENWNNIKLAVLGQGGVVVENGFKLIYKGNMPLTPEIIASGGVATELPCRIKVEEDSGQYSINGRKYTIMFGEKKSGSGSGGSKGGGGYKAPTPEEVRGKVVHGVVCAAIQSVQIICVTEDDVNKWTDFIMSGGKKPTG